MQVQYFISRISIILLMSDFDTGSLAVLGQFGTSGGERQSRKEGYSLRTSLANNIAVRSQPVSFFLFTRNGSEMVKPVNASFSQLFSGDRETKVVVHGFMQSATDPVYIKIKNDYLRNKDVNVIMVDWPHAQIFSYSIAATVTEFVGKQTAELLTAMNPNLGYVHVIGFGLGAHIGGIVGVELNSEVGRITGLDPSLPLFRMLDTYFILDQEDGKYVDIIHTDAGDNFWFANHLGMGKPSGSVDFYPNRGIFQPGCPNSSILNYDDMYCSHFRALEIFAASVEDPNKFLACKCSTWLDFMDSKCDCTNENNLITVGEGEGTSGRKVYGKYYFITNSINPYGMGKQGSRSPRENTLQELIESLGNLTKITSTSEELNNFTSLTFPIEKLTAKKHVKFSTSIREELEDVQKVTEELALLLALNDEVQPTSSPLIEQNQYANSTDLEEEKEIEILEKEIEKLEKEKEKLEKEKEKLENEIPEESTENYADVENQKEKFNFKKIAEFKIFRTPKRGPFATFVNENKSEKDDVRQSDANHNDAKDEVQIPSTIESNSTNDDTINNESKSEEYKNDSVEERRKKINLLYIIGTLKPTPDNIDGSDTYRIM